MRRGRRERTRPLHLRKVVGDDGAVSVVAAVHLAVQPRERFPARDFLRRQIALVRVFRLRRLRPDFDALHRIRRGVHLREPLGVGVVQCLRAAPEVLREVADAELRLARRVAPVVVGEKHLRRTPRRRRCAEHLHRAVGAATRQRVVPVVHRLVVAAVGCRRTRNPGRRTAIAKRRELDPAGDRVVIRRHVLDAVVVRLDVQLRHDLLAVRGGEADGRQIGVAERIHVNPHPLVRVVVRTDVFHEIRNLLEIFRRALSCRRIGIGHVDVGGRRDRAAELEARAVAGKLALRRRAKFARGNGWERRRGRERAVRRRIDVRDDREPPFRHLVVAQPVGMEIVA